VIKGAWANPVATRGAATTLRFPLVAGAERNENNVSNNIEKEKKERKWVCLERARRGERKPLDMWKLVTAAAGAGLTSPAAFPDPIKVRVVAEGCETMRAVCTATNRASADASDALGRRHSPLAPTAAGTVEGGAVTGATLGRSSPLPSGGGRADIASACPKASRICLSSLS
jgi:hypothetical protein